MKQTLLIANRTNFDLVDDTEIIKAIKKFDKENEHDLLIIPIDDTVNWDNTIDYFKRLGMSYNWVTDVTELEEVYGIKKVKEYKDAFDEEFGDAIKFIEEHEG